MSQLLIVIFSLLGLINTVSNAIIQEGVCDYKISVVPQFNVTAYQGVWYDIESLPSEFQDGACNTATYNLNSAGTALNLQNTQISNGILNFTTGTAQPQVGAAGSAKFDVTIEPPGSTPVPYWVLDTDYETFALVYSCRNNTGTNTRTINSWKLGRKKGPLPNDINIRINDSIEGIESLKNASNQFITRDHSEEACSYFVDFDGPCPTTVTGVADFDVNKFLGTWYEVARYPQTAQTGQCNRAVYTASATTPGVVDVENSQVTDETRLTISGVASATEQPGVLAVNFTIGDGKLFNLY
ncbi:hypothetical protein PYW08_007807 [Mythimna loreyi]|uniref:Uncharacterized protein n=1 Tax=Mythimna loreyi TaxID=667449 RepID=A0ACC2QCT7_9NEOP|nr:hypothetical protein PYW08_007807 [Mythimna loreyi]